MRVMVGIDEVGRGSLAGPVVVATVALSKNVRFSARGGSAFGGRINDLGKLKDSKKLSPRQRERWYGHFKAHPHIHYVTARVYPWVIDRMNISKAANLAAMRAFERLCLKCQVSRVTCRVFLDGGLFIGNGVQSRNAKTVIRGDQKYTAIKVASIIAKVTRDRYMARLAKREPRYGFEIHKGYGTLAHRRAIKKHGASREHRLTFLGSAVQ